MLIKNTYRNYTPEEILYFFQEDYKWHNLVDVDADNKMEIRKEMSLFEWRQFQNLVSWNKLYIILNDLFHIQTSPSMWKEAILPEQNKILWDLCIFLSQQSKKEIIQPVEILGKKCLGAAVFLTLRKNLHNRKMHIDDLRPSTFLSQYIDGYYGYYVFVEINLIGVKLFDTLHYKLKEDISFWQKINIFNPHRHHIDTGSIKTFKDLSKKIAENLLSQ